MLVCDVLKLSALLYVISKRGLV